MTIWFITRHPGALEWMQSHRIPFDRHESHLDLAKICAGDTVIGSLPVNLAAEVCAQGAVYQHLSLRLKSADRGRELSVAELDSYEATLHCYDIRRLS
jgi:CRISPR-associated protein Csx16